MESFKLTKKQIDIVGFSLGEAEFNAGKGKPGIVLAQIGPTESGDVICKFEFIENKRAVKIKEIINEKS